MSTLSTLALVLAIATVGSAASIWSGGSLHDRDEVNNKCIELPDYMKTYCGYDVTYFPNSRGHTTFDDAFKEFKDFGPMMGNGNGSPCSEHIGNLLCYHYFPFSNCNPDDEDGSKPTISGTNAPSNIFQIGPCRESCIKAQSSSRCTASIEQSQSRAWANIEHLNCSNFLPSSTSLCSNSPLTRILQIPVPSITPSPKTEPSTEPFTSLMEPTISSTEKQVTAATTTKGPKKEMTCTGTKDCSFRPSASGKVFKVNRNYTYAIKAIIMGETVDSEDPKVIKYKVNVIQSYDTLRTCKHHKMEDAPTISTGENIVYIGDKDGNKECVFCEANLLCSNETQQVLISGTHETADDGTVKLWLDCSEYPLVTQWSPRFNSRLSRWVNQGNDYRSNICKK